MEGIGQLKDPAALLLHHSTQSCVDRGSIWML